MANKFTLSVSYRDGYVDPQARSAQSELVEQGLAVHAVAGAKLYCVAGDVSQEDVTRLANELLADPVTQEWTFFSTDTAHSPTQPGPAPVYRCEVWPKEAVSDPVSESVQMGMKTLGLPEAQSIRCGDAYWVEGTIRERDLERALLGALVNPVIHQWSIRALSL